MKLKLISFYLMFLLPAFNAECQGFLKVSGRQIVNEKGENVLLRGIGLGGWSWPKMLSWKTAISTTMSLKLYSEDNILLINKIKL